MNIERAFLYRSSNKHSHLNFSFSIFEEQCDYKNFSGLHTIILYASNYSISLCEGISKRSSYYIDVCKNDDLSMDIRNFKDIYDDMLQEAIDDLHSKQDSSLIKEIERYISLVGDEERVVKLVNQLIVRKTHEL